MNEYTIYLCLDENGIPYASWMRPKQITDLLFVLVGFDQRPIIYDTDDNEIGVGDSGPDVTL